MEVRSCGELVAGAMAPSRGRKYALRVASSGASARISAFAYSAASQTRLASPDPFGTCRHVGIIDILELGGKRATGVQLRFADVDFAKWAPLFVATRSTRASVALKKKPSHADSRDMEG